MKLSLLTAGEKQSQEYRYFPEPPQAWWKDLQDGIESTLPGACLQTRERQWSLYLGGIPTSRRDMHGRLIQATLVLEGECGTPDGETAFGLLRAWMADIQDMQGRRQGPSRVSDAVDRHLSGLRVDSMFNGTLYLSDLQSSLEASFRQVRDGLTAYVPASHPTPIKSTVCGAVTSPEAVDRWLAAAQRLFQGANGRAVYLNNATAKGAIPTTSPVPTTVLVTASFSPVVAQAPPAPISATASNADVAPASKPHTSLLHHGGNLSLAAMTGGFLASYFVMPHWGWSPVALESARHFFEAGMVGGVADWFAVTALFKKPLGILPGRILQNGKEQIQDNMVSMMREIVPKETIVAKIQNEFHPVDLVVTQMRKPSAKAMVRDQVQSLGTNILPGPAVDRFRQDILAAIQRTAEAGQINYAALVGQYLRGNTQTLDGQIDQMAKAIVDGFSTQAPVAIRHAVRQKLPSVPFVDKDAVANLVTEQVLSTFLTQQTTTMVTDTLKDQVRRYGDRLTQDSQIQDRAHRWVNEKLHEVGAYNQLDQASNIAVQRLVEDLRGTDSQALRLLDDLYDQTLKTLETESIRQTLNDQIRQQLAKQVSDELLDVIGEQIKGAIATMDADEFAAKLEERSGGELQMIRINGALVGGAIGLGIYWLSLLFPH